MTACSIKKNAYINKLSEVVDKYNKYYHGTKIMK